MISASTLTCIVAVNAMVKPPKNDLFLSLYYKYLLLSMEFTMLYHKKYSAVNIIAIKNTKFKITIDNILILWYNKIIILLTMNGENI